MQIQECIAPLFCHYCPLGRWPLVLWVVYWWQNQHRIPVVPQVACRSNRKCSRRELPPVRFACKVNFTESSDVIYNSVMGAFVWLVNSVFCVWQNGCVSWAAFSCSWQGNRTAFCFLVTLVFSHCLCCSSLW